MTLLMAQPKLAVREKPKPMFGTVMTVTPTVTVGAYSADDALGGLLVFEDTLPYEGPIGADVLWLVESVVIVDLAKQNVPIDLLLSTVPFAATADNAAFDPSDTDILKFLAPISVGAYYSFADSSIAATRGVNLPFHPLSAATPLYGQMVTRGTPTYAAVGDVQVTVTVLKG